MIDGALLIHSEKKLKTIRAAKRTIANSARDSLPVPHFALKTTLNTNV
tara:strand:+ start:204 stop:347 length:144 start_codon:yes stop_codon:yes gene_type:complete